jgi:uncharacterized protein YggU (UPF0235/DUF167 family)
MRLTVRVTPRGGRDAVEGWTRDGAGRPVLKVRVAAAAADGKANAAVLALIAGKLGVAPSSLTLVRGQTARVKQIDLGGAGEAGVLGAFGKPPV